MAKHNLGMVTAYAYAVAGGYTGTEAEFEALLGNIATDLEEIENLTVTATTLPEGSSATASYSDGVLTLGIPKGDTGATGAGATVAAGTTTTGAPGTNASVVNAGTAKDAVFNFTIPRGNTGNGIESIYLTGTSGAVKTYTILYTDGNTTTFDVTDGEVTNATLAAVLADYAKVDGYYESLGSGTADQLSSNIFEENSEPYNFRTSGGSIDIGDRETEMLVGGTVAWNQLADNNQAPTSRNGVTFERHGDYFTMDGTATSNISASGWFALTGDVSAKLNGHKMLVDFQLISGTVSDATYVQIYINGRSSARVAIGQKRIFQCDESTNNSEFGISNGNVVTNVKARLQVFDLTAMLGSTIADYIYSLETANAGAGVAWFRKLFPKPFYAYNAGELMSVQAVSHDMVGFNQFDASDSSNWENWYIGSGVINSGAYYKSAVIPCIPNTKYYACKELGSRLFLASFPTYPSVGDTATAYQGNNVGKVTELTTGANDHYLVVWFYNQNADGTNYQAIADTLNVNISWDGERDGEYEAYVKHSYALDSDLVLRGIPKLDASNNLYYDGDTYESDGTVTRKYGIVDLGSLSWYYNSGKFVAVYPSMKKGTDNIICQKYTATGHLDYLTTDKTINTTNYHFSDPEINIYDSAYSDATAFKSAMSGVYLVCELATPTTETADPYTNPQIVNDFGTEEYVDYAVSQSTRDVAIPVGHQTQYMANLKAKLEMSPNSPEGAGDYIVRQTNGENEYVALASNATIQDIIARLEALEGGGE